MKKKNRIISLILVALFAVESFSMNSYAANNYSYNEHSKMTGVNGKQVVLKDSSKNEIDEESGNTEQKENSESMDKTDSEEKLSDDINNTDDKNMSNDISDENESEDINSDISESNEENSDDSNSVDQNQNEQNQNEQNQNEQNPEDINPPADGEDISDDEIDDIISSEEEASKEEDKSKEDGSDDESTSQESSDKTRNRSLMKAAAGSGVKYNSIEEAQAAGFTFTRNYTKLALSKYTGSDEHVVIPYMVGNENVVYVMENAFKDNSVVKEIDFPETLDTVYDNSINNCINLSRINILGDSCGSYIGRNIVANCPNIQTVYLGKNVTDYYESYSQRIETKEYLVDKNNTVYYNDDDGILFKKKDNKTTLCYYPIRNEKTVLVLKNKMNDIGNSAFSGAKYLEELTISNDIEPITMFSPFYKMPSIKKVTLNNVTDYCSLPSLTPLLREVHVTGAGDATVRLDVDEKDCIDLVDIGSGIKEIYLGSGSSNKCLVKKLIIGPDVTERAESSSEDYLGMVRLNIEEVEVDESNTTFKIDNGALVNSDGTKLYAVLRDTESDTYTIKDGITEIYYNAFRSVPKLSKIEIPSSVKKIDYDAFYNCSSLNSILIPETVEIIDRSILNDYVTIYGYPDTAAEQYAKEHKNKFIDVTKLDEDVATDDFGSDLYIENEKATEIIPKGDTYVIENAHHLAWVEQVVNDGTNDFEGKILKLAADIDISAVEWTPIGIGGQYTFKGSFDGQNHTINGLNMNDKDPGGLFGVVESDVSSKTTTFKNVNLKNVNIKGGNTCGSLIGYLVIDKGACTSISGINTTGKFESHGTVGGIVCGVGCATNATLEIKNCTVHADMVVIGGNGGFDTSGGKAGGIVKSIGGLDYTSGKGAVIDECSFYGSITTTKQRSAGAGIIWSIDVGSGEYTISNCVVRGVIEGTSQATNGGIISGVGSNTEVYRCLNFATVRNGYQTGGIAASNSGVIRECENDGEVSCVGTLAPNGGIVASNGGIIVDCCNFGLAKTHNYTGGIAGQNSGTIERCYDAAVSEYEGGLWYGNGSITSYNTGEVLYTYSDGETLFGKGQMASEENVKTSRICSPAQMMDEANYETWDFDTIWEIDPEYCYGYPVISAIKSKSKKRYIKDTSVLGFKYERVKVVDENGKPVEGAEVKLGEGESLAVETTDKFGSAKFDRTRNRKCLLVSKEGYHSYSDPDFVMPRSHEYNVRLVSNDADPYSLGSVIMTYNTNRYELLSEEKTINKVNKDTSFSISCKLADETMEIDSFEISQPDVKDGLCYSSQDGNFKFEISQFATTQYKNKVRPIYITVIDKQLKEHKTQINLQVINVEEKDVSEFSFGDDLSVKINENVPVFGGSELELSTLSLPITWTVSEDKWELGVNCFSIELDDDENTGKRSFQAKIFNDLAAENNMSKKYEKFKKAYKNYAKNKDTLVSKNPDVSFQLIGYASGDLPVESADFTLRLYAAFSVGATTEGMIAGVPGTVFAFDINGTVYADGSLKFDSSYNGLPSPDFNNSTIKIGGTVEASLFGGGGIPYLVAAGVYGGGEFGISGIVVGPVRGIDEIYLQGDFGAAVRVLGSNAASVPILSSDKIYLYKKDTSTDRSTLKKSRATLKSSLSSLEDTTISPVDRSSYNSSKDAWNGETDDNSILISDAYPDLQPQVFTCGGKTIMLLLDDGDAKRNNNDKSMLMYSILENGKWSKPVAVWDDKTADMSFSVYSDGTDAYVVWNNEKGTVKDNSTFTDVAVSSELAVAKYDAASGVFVDAQNITSNNKYETNPNVTIVDSVPYISWTENTNNDIWRLSGTNNLYVASKNQSWNIQKITEIDSSIIDETIGLYGNEIGYAYISCDMNSIGDSSSCYPHLVTLDGDDTSLADTPANNIRFINNGGSGSVIWKSTDGTLFKKSSDDDAKDFANYISGDIRYIYDDTSTNKKYIIYTRNDGGKTNAYMIVGDTTTDTWSGEIAITKKDAYIENISAFQENGKLYVSYNQRELDPDSDDYNGTSDLIWEEVDTSTSSLEIKDFDYDPFELKQGEGLNATLTVHNNGSKDVSNARVKIVSDNETFYDEVFNETIYAGKDKEIELNIPIPDDFTKQEVEIIVTDEDDSSSEKKAVWNETLGNAVLSLDLKKYCFNGNYEFVTTVTNSGYDLASGSIEVYNTDTGKIYESSDFKNLGNDESINISTGVKGVNWDAVNILHLGFRIVNVNNDVILDDTDRTTLIEKKNSVPVTGMKLSQYTAELSAENPTVQLEAFVVPDDADNQNYTWKSSDESVAKVDENGLVSAINGGEARIYAISEDGNKAVSCKITSSLPKLAKKLAIKYCESYSSYEYDAKNIKLYPFETLQLHVKPYPEDASLDSLKWIVDDPKVAKVSSDGILTGIKPGKTTITAECGKGKASFEVNVTKRYDKEVWCDSIEDLKDVPAGQTTYYMSNNPDTKYLSITFEPDTYVGTNDLYIYDFEGNLIAKPYYNYMVNKEYIIPGNGVKLYLEDWTSKEYSFSIKEIKEFTDDNIVIDGDEITLKSLETTKLRNNLVLPKSDTDDDSEEFEIESEDSDIVRVEEDGEIRALKPGSTTVKQKYSNVTINYPVTVENDESFKFVTNAEDIKGGGNEDCSFGYISPDPNTKYIKIEFSDDSYLENNSLFISGTAESRWVNFNYEDQRVFYIEGDLFKLEYRRFGEETGGFQVNSIETFEDLPLNDFSIDDMTVKLHMDTYIPINLDPKELSGITIPVSWSVKDASIVEMNKKSINGLKIGTTKVTAQIKTASGVIEKSFNVTVEAREFEVYDDEYCLINGELSPELDVRDYDQWYTHLEEGVDYTVKIDGNKVIVTGIGDYVGCSEEFTVEVIETPDDPDSGNGNNGGKDSNSGSGKNSNSNNNKNSTKPASDIKVNKISIKGISKKIAAGKTIKLSADVQPQNAKNKTLAWSSSNKKYATVDKNGKVKLLKKGAGKSVKIIATATDGSKKTAVYKIKIMKHAVTKIKISGKKSVKAGKKLKLKTKIKTSGKKVNKKLKWSSSNTAYATVNSKGVVKTKKAGKGKKVTITAKSTDGSNKSAKIKIKIKK